MVGWFSWIRRTIPFLLFTLLGGMHWAADSEIGVRGGRLVVAQTGGPRSFNRLLTSDQDTAAFSEAIMASLVTINRQTQRVDPMLAERWSLSKDGRVLTLHLRKDVRFSDGRPFTADDVLFTFVVILDDAIRSVAAPRLTMDGKKVRVEKMDTYRVRMTFPQTLAVADRLLDGIPILPRHVLEPYYKKGTLSTAWNLSAVPASIVGLGPFRLKQVTAGQRVVVERNPYYWRRDSKGQPLPYLDEIVFEIIPEKGTQLLKFQQGQLDVLKPLDGQEAAALRDLERKGTVKVFDVGPSLINDVLWFNQDDAKNPKSGKPWIEPYRLRWFQTPAFRQAVSYAIDREAILRVVFGRYAAPSWGPVTPGNRLWYNGSVPRYPYNPHKARSLLEGAQFRYKDAQLYDRDGHSVTFVLSTNAGNAIRQKMSAMIQQDLAQIGIKVTLAPTDTRTFLNQIDDYHDYEAGLLSLLSGDTDPSAEMNVLLSRGSGHWWHVRQSRPATPWEERIDRLMVEQLHTLDPARRKRLFDEVQFIMAEQQPFIYLSARHLIVAAKTRLANVKPAVLNDFILWNCDELFWKN